MLPEDSSRQESIIGVSVGIVTNNQDPEGLGRVKICFPWVEGQEESYWARIATPMAGNKRGIFFLPEVGDEVLVAFEQGNIDYPVVIGALWNGRDLPPEDNADGQNNRRLIRSRSGHEIIFDDTQGSETLILKSAGGQKITLKAAQGQEIISIGDAQGNQMVIRGAKGQIEIKAQGEVILEALNIKIKAGANLELSSSGTVTIRGAMVQIN
ncbi:phage baseplate assembly protein V [Thermosulfuriphilus sp.]